MELAQQVTSPGGSGLCNQTRSLTFHVRPLTLSTLSARVILSIPRPLGLVVVHCWHRTMWWGGAIGGGGVECAKGETESNFAS